MSDRFYAKNSTTEFEGEEPEMNIHRKYRRKPRNFHRDLPATVDDVKVIDDVTITTADD